MVNERKLAAAERARVEEPAGQFALKEGGEDDNYAELLNSYTGRRFAEGEGSPARRPHARHHRRADFSR